MRDLYCGDVNESHIGKEITLCGWVNRRRDLGAVIFLDLRDREGMVQVVYDPDLPEVIAKANTLRNEFCVQIKGKVRARPEGQINKDMKTGAIEILGLELNILNKSAPLPLDSNMSVGYGDIIPISSLAQKATVLIGLAGEIYLVVITGIVIGKYLNQLSKKNPIIGPRRTTPSRSIQRAEHRQRQQNLTSNRDVRFC